ncbi:MAG: radical SAM family heme chaperone HemW [Bacillota bacterium]|nr:radical SAM family heme chaperone HemW [Bacillota bacterium]
MTWGLYVHLPFCVRKCVYCDFPVVLWNSGRPEAYSLLLQREASFLRSSLDLQGPPATLYFGGGTPSTTPPSALKDLIGKLEALFGPFSETMELTLEANPETVTADDLFAWREMGINRVSVGVQTSSEETLRLLGRLHTRDQVERLLAQLPTLFPTWNMDLIYGLPGENLSSWQKTLSWALSFAPPHLSAYSLQVEERTPLWYWVREGKVQLPPEEEVADMMAWAREYLPSQGFFPYEISNFSRPGHESRHNLLYWRNGNYLGLGLGAHSHMEGIRWANVERLGRYRELILQGFSPVDPGSVIPGDRRRSLSDAMIMGLRLAEGVDLLELKDRYGEDPGKVFGGSLQRLKERGLLQMEGSRVRLTAQGVLLGNLVFQEFL